MRLLICTQAVDQDDPSLGFFHEWIAAFSKEFDSVEVVCLKKGRYTLPANVHVHSLGKSAQGRPVSGWERVLLRIRYIAYFFLYVWSLRREYDEVFVHQSQEYVLLGGWLWRILGKKVFMWRNHYAGTYLTDIAASFCNKIFCTSKHSYTARYKKTVLMPVGVDVAMFTSGTFPRTPRSILFLGRIALSKGLNTLIEALGLLAERGVAFSATLCGPTLPKDEPYLTSLKRRVDELQLRDRVAFRDGVAHAATPALYASHEIFINLSGSGMYDKTIFEAAACGCIIVALSRDFAEISAPQFVPADESPAAVADTLEQVLKLPAAEKVSAVQAFRSLAEKNSLMVLTARLAEEIKV